VPNDKAIKLTARISDNGDDRSSRRANEDDEFEADGLLRCAAFIITDNSADCGKFELMIQLKSG
jgi:hypothetical protein